MEHADAGGGSGLERVAAGMHGARLPDCYEVCDAELHAILMALRKTVQRDAPEDRRCLILSDCLSAIQMVEQAWRTGVRWTGSEAGRAPLLHAINAARGRLQLVVIVWQPAHRGNATSAYADAVAKAYLGAQHSDEAMEWIRDSLPHGKQCITVSTDGGEAVWMRSKFDSTRDGVGWWVGRRETAGARSAGGAQRPPAVDTKRRGAEWAARVPDRWEEVWLRTGVGVPRVAKEAEKDEEGNDEDEQAERDILQAAEEWAAYENRGGTQTRQKGKTQAATGVARSQDAARGGVSMAARAGKLWEAGTWHGPQGCPGCCTAAHGWGWTELYGGHERVWRRIEGRHPVENQTPATWAHVICGECTGVDAEVSTTGRERIRKALQTTRHALRAKTRRGVPHVHGDVEAAVERIAAAQRALAKGSKRATREESEALRKWMGGELPPVKPKATQGGGGWRRGRWSRRYGRRNGRRRKCVRRGVGRRRRRWRSGKR